MKTYVYYISVFCILALALSSCFGTDFTDDFDKLKEKSADGGSSGACPVGTWKTPTCNGASGKFLLYNFASDGTGYSSNPDCNGVCSGPLKFNFRYTITGNAIKYKFTGADRVTCNGTSSTPTINTTNEYTITFTCGNSGSQLTTETANVQTGVRTTMVFTRM